MTSRPIRNPKQDHLISTKNSALVIVDYQPTQVNSINSMNRAQLVKNITLVAKIAKAYELPIILSTVNVKTGINKETIPALKEVLGNIPSYDRTSINAWEDKEFYKAIKATKRKKLIMTALWTEACLAFPTLDALEEYFEVYPVVDAIGGTSVLAHESALCRMQQFGAQPISIAQLACELQRDWNRKKTVPDFLKIMFESGIFLKLD